MLPGLGRALRLRIREKVPETSRFPRDVAALGHDKREGHPKGGGRCYGRAVGSKHTSQAALPPPRSQSCQSGSRLPLLWPHTQPLVPGRGLQC